MKNARVRPPCPRQSWRKAPGCLPCVILEENGHPASEVRFLGSISSLSRRGEYQKELGCLACALKRTYLDGSLGSEES
jgi:hypothetical protein